MAGCVSAALVFQGCGAAPTQVAAVSVVLSDCDSVVTNDGSRELESVILDWNGGISPLYPNKTFNSIDFSRFRTTDGGTLAHREVEFQEAVRLKVVTILCEFPEFAVRVQNGNADDAVSENVVQFAAMKSPRGDGQIGEGEYDPCNEFSNNSAVIFGDELRMLGQQFSFEDWAFVFANVTAHEIGHLLGYAHAERPREPVEDRSLYVELMYATHTVDEMLREQRLLADLPSCPADAVRGRLNMNEPDTWTHSNQ